MTTTLNEKSMAGKICLITGATSGIGKTTALGLAKLGMNVIFNTRDETRGQKVKDELIRQSGNQNIEVQGRYNYVR